MDVVYHLGVHGTDDDRIVGVLRDNADACRDAGLHAPVPKSYRKKIGETMISVDQNDISQDIQADMRSAIGADDAPARVFLSDPAFLGLPGQAIGSGQFYPLRDEKIGKLTRLFGAQNTSFVLGVCNPALFIPAVFNEAEESDFSDFLDGSDPMQLRWSELIGNIRQAAPDSPVTVWANEDSPLIWPQIVAAASELENPTTLKNFAGFYRSVLVSGGFDRMAGYLKTHPPRSVAHFQKIAAAFLDKFGNEDATWAAVDLPGWTEGYIAALGDLYEKDLEVIARMDGVTFLQP